MCFPPLAQLDRVSDSDSEGRGFDSPKAGQKNGTVFDCPVFYPIRRIGMKSRISGYVIAVRRMLFGTESFLRIDYIHFLAKMVTFRLRRITYKASP